MSRRFFAADTLRSKIVRLNIRIRKMEEKRDDLIIELQKLEVET